MAVAGAVSHDRERCRKSKVERVRLKERDSERECVEERRKENMEIRGGEEEEKREVRECNCGLAKSDRLIGLAAQAGLTSG